MPYHKYYQAARHIKPSNWHEISPGMRRCNWTWPACSRPWQWITTEENVIAKQCIVVDDEYVTLENSVWGPSWSKNFRSQVGILFP